jgi:hypothetical protein
MELPLIARMITHDPRMGTSTDAGFKVHLALVNDQDASSPIVKDVQMPCIPRVGDIIVFKGSENYRVEDIAFHFDELGNYQHVSVTCKAWFIKW